MGEGGFGFAGCEYFSEKDSGGGRRGRGNADDEEQNYAVMHSRSPWKGERVVLAALWDEGGRVGDYPEGEEILNGSPRKPVVAKDED